MPTFRPSCDVVDLAVIGSMPTIRYRAGWHGGTCQVTLFTVGEPLCVIQIHRTFLRVEQGDLQVVAVMLR